MHKALDMLQVFNKKRDLYCYFLTDFSSCFRVSVADFAWQGILGLENNGFCTIYFPANKHMLKVSKQQKP